MSGLYDDLVKEGQMINEKNKKLKSKYKVFGRFLLAVIYTCFISLVYYQLNEIFNIYIGWIITPLWLLYLYKALNAYDDLDNKKAIRPFLFYINLAAVKLIPNMDLDNLFGLAIQIAIGVVIYFIAMLVADNKAGQVVYVVSIFILYSTTSILQFVGIWKLVASLVIVIWLFNRVKQQSADSTISQELLNKKAYLYLVCIYTAFMAMYM